MRTASASFVTCLSRVRGQLARTVLRGGKGREALPLPDSLPHPHRPRRRQLAPLVEWPAAGPAPCPGPAAIRPATAANPASCSPTSAFVNIVG
jgi:hypothetical protein